MATGSGKTVVMAMCEAQHVYRNREFSDKICAPTRSVFPRNKS